MWGRVIIMSQSSIMIILQFYIREFKPGDPSVLETAPLNIIPNGEHIEKLL